MENIKVKNKFNNLTDAIHRLKEVIEIKDVKEDIKRDSVIQRFEFTFELFWNYLKRYMNSKGEKMESAFPKDVLIIAYKYHLIDNEKLWLNMLLDRNKTSHIYDEEQANEIYKNIVNIYYPEIQKTYNKLEKTQEK